jgi:CheY-like chemotaxis protein
MTTLLHCEDSLTDVTLMREALKSANNQINYVHANNGSEGIEHLETAEELPKLILLDLNMPKVNGFEFLTRRMENALWRKIPVVVLTSSDYPNDIRKSYELSANAYVQKVFDFGEFKELVKTTVDFWIGRNQLD